MEFDTVEIINKNAVVFTESSGLEGSINFSGSVRQAATDIEQGILLVVVESEGVQTLFGLKLDGTELFQVPPPKGWNFYYLSTHVNHKLAVVCVSETERFDWFYSICPKTGFLTPLNRAY